MIYGFGYKPEFYRGSTGREYHLFAIGRESLPAQPPPDYRRANRDYPHSGKGKFRLDLAWATDTPLLGQALVKANEALFLAGPPADATRSMLAFEGREGAILHAASTADGTAAKTWSLPALPVHDGLAAARGRLYISLADGSLLCLGADGKPLPPYAAAARAAGKPREAGFVGHWPFDEGAGPVARDASGVGNDADVAGSWSGRALATRGAPNAATIQDHPLLQFGKGDFTLAFAVAIDGYDCRILGKQDFPRNWWVVNVLKDGRAELVLGTGREEGKSVRPTTKSPLAKGDWTHLAFVVDRTKGSVATYLDGKLERTTKLPEAFIGALDVKGRDVHISTAYKPFKGRLADLRVYRRPLTDAEVKAICDALEVRK
jgi:hypothetical protein